MKALGINHMVKNINLERYKLSNNSMEHNTNLTRELLYDWAKLHILLGKFQEWKHAARNCDFAAEVLDTNLWLDSTDISIERRPDRGPSSRHWSGKLGRPGSRFMVLQDAHATILKIWGGYSPKVYDSDFLEVEKVFFEEKLEDGVIIADNHFSGGKKLFKKPKFYTNFAERPKKRPRDASSDLEDLTLDTKKQRKFNVGHSHARARVERPFGHLKVKFEALDVPWAGELHQLTCLVFYNKNSQPITVYNR